MCESVLHKQVSRLKYDRTPSPAKHRIQTDKTYKNKVIKEGIKDEKNIYIYMRRKQMKLLEIKDLFTGI